METWLCRNQNSRLFSGLPVWFSGQVPAYVIVHAKEQDVVLRSVTESQSVGKDLFFLYVGCAMVNIW